MITSKYFDSTFLPAKFNGPKRSTKLMVMMHGLGDSKESYKDFALEINLTCIEYLLVNAPTPYYFGYSWYDIPPGEPRDGVESSIGKIELLLNELNAKGYQDEDIILGGFSQGGCIALHSFLSLQRNLAGVVCLSPRVYLDKMNVGTDEINTRTPLFIAHGISDQAISFAETKSQIDRLKSQGLDISFHEYCMGHEIDIHEIRDLSRWLNERL